MEVGVWGALSQYGHAGAASSFILFYVSETDELIALKHARGGVLGGIVALTTCVYKCLVKLLRPHISGIARIS